jgi:hypothetical protein
MDIHPGVRTFCLDPIIICDNIRANALRQANKLVGQKQTKDDARRAQHKNVPLAWTRRQIMALAVTRVTHPITRWTSAKVNNTRRVAATVIAFRAFL